MAVASCIAPASGAPPKPGSGDPSASNRVTNPCAPFAPARIVDPSGCTNMPVHENRGWRKAVGACDACGPEGWLRRAVGIEGQDLASRAGVQRNAVGATRRPGRGRSRTHRCPRSNARRFRRCQSSDPVHRPAKAWPPTPGCRATRPGRCGHPPRSRPNVRSAHCRPDRSSSRCRHRQSRIECTIRHQAKHGQHRCVVSVRGADANGFAVSL
jgi:hypothetical protein